MLPTASLFALALATNLVSAAAVINSPASLTQCQNVSLSWTGAQGDVFVSLIPGGQAGAQPLKQFPAMTGASGAITWEVDRPVGESITVQINDQTGVQNFAKAVTVMPGVTNDCEGKGTVAPGAGASMATTPSTPTTPTTPTTPGTGAGTGNDDDDDDDDAPGTAAGAGAAAGTAVGNAANRTATAVGAAANATANALGSARNATASVFRNATAAAPKNSASGIAPPSSVYALGAAIIIGAIGAFAL